MAGVARLATASPTGEPHVVPVCFVLDGRTVYSAIDSKPKRVAPRMLRRLQNIANNPRAMLLVDHYEEDWSRLRYMMVSGRAAILESGGGTHLGIARHREVWIFEFAKQGSIQLNMLDPSVKYWWFKRRAPKMPLWPFWKYSTLLDLLASEL
jgi:PPOX class probable F420-dependent enzyme